MKGRNTDENKYKDIYSSSNYWPPLHLPYQLSPAPRNPDNRVTGSLRPGAAKERLLVITPIPVCMFAQFSQKLVTEKGDQTVT